LKTVLTIRTVPPLVERPSIDVRRTVRTVRTVLLGMAGRLSLREAILGQTRDVERQALERAVSAVAEQIQAAGAIVDEAMASAGTRWRSARRCSGSGSFP
jgi:hypothetical protein